ncbi:MAG: DnaA/Hda family protein [Phycisphaerales bacterium]|nr:DnaA/Hda family protein [Phycisphaerales bacterium]
MPQPNSSPSERHYRDNLKAQIGTRPYNMWLCNAKIEIGIGEVQIIAPTKLNADWLSQKYNSPIEDATLKTFGNNTKVTIAASSQDVSQKTAATGAAKKPAQHVRKKPTQQLLSFSDFVVGQCNQLAHAASRQMTHEDGKTISPLFIHGKPGVGKTHLLQSICKHAAKTTASKVKYVTAEQFTNEFIQSSRFGEFERFRNRYRFLDLLAIDDVRFVQSKTKTQEELLHTIDAAGLRGARLVLASDEEPRLIKRLNKALANRFVAGMVVEIERPDRKTRLDIIEQLTKKHCIELSPGAVQRLASQAVGSVRELQGAVATLRATASLMIDTMNDTIGAQVVDRVLRATPVNTLPIKFSYILEEASKRGGLTVQDLRGKSRTSTIVFWRTMAYYLGRKMTTLSYPELAFALGRGSHSPVHAAVKNMEIFLDQEDTTRKLGGETVNVQELVDQLTWSIRLRANKGD